MRQSDEPTDRERCEMEIIKSLMRSYFDIARKNFQVSRVRSDHIAPSPGVDRLDLGAAVHRNIYWQRCLVWYQTWYPYPSTGERMTTPTTPFGKKSIRLAVFTLSLRALLAPCGCIALRAHDPPFFFRHCAVPWCGLSQDLVPKTIMHFLVNEVINMLQVSEHLPMTYIGTTDAVGATASACRWRVLWCLWPQKYVPLAFMLVSSERFFAV